MSVIIDNLSSIIKQHDPSALIRQIYNALDRFVDNLISKKKDMNLDELRKLISKARNLSPKTDMAQIKSILAKIGLSLNALEAREGVEVPKPLQLLMARLTGNKKGTQGPDDPQGVPEGGSINDLLASSSGTQDFDPLKALMPKDPNDPKDSESPTVYTTA